MVTNAPRANSEVLAIPPRLLPDHIEWGNFLQVWLYLPFGRFFPNSALVALAVTIITVVASCLSAYAFARLRFPFRGSLFVVYIATLMVPPAVLVIPLFLLMSQLGWVNSYEALILPMAFSSFGTFLPLSVPVIGLLALFTFTAQWNSFLWPLIAVNHQAHTTLPLGLTQFQGQQGTQWNLLMAGTTITIRPGVDREQPCSSLKGRTL